MEENSQVLSYVAILPIYLSFGLKMIFFLIKFSKHGSNAIATLGFTGRGRVKNKNIDKEREVRKSNQKDIR